MRRSDVVLSLPGLNKLMTSRDVQSLVDERGRRMAAAAGDGFEYVSRPHRWTARGFVQVDSVEGARRQARDAVLERVVSS